VFGKDHAAAGEMLPRYDLAPWIGAVGHVEASRACNFQCTFCSLTAEGRPYRIYDLEHVRRQIVALGCRRFLVFVDNNFCGNSREALHARIAMLREMRAEGWFRGWGALVTSDFFLDEENVRAAAESGCKALFCGIESFDRETLLGYRKRHNTQLPQVELFRRSLDAGILLVYGVILDPARRRLADIRAELDFIIDNPEIALPSIHTLTIPYPGTPFFRECAAAGRLMPGTRLCDLDGKTLSVLPLDPLEDVLEFLRDLQTVRGRRWRSARHFALFARRYRRSLGPAQILVQAAREASLLGAFRMLDALGERLRGAASRRTHLAGTERLDPSYRPTFPVAARFERWFRPTRLIDERGEIDAALAEDLLAVR
jgi:radical SAM superfamily enzyme YgiQ (UPF0313 family)